MEHLVTVLGHNKNPFLGDYFCDPPKMAEPRTSNQVRSKSSI